MTKQSADCAHSIEEEETKEVMLTGIHIFGRHCVERVVGSTQTFRAVHGQAEVEGVDLWEEVVLAVVEGEDLLGYHHCYRFPVLSCCPLFLRWHSVQLPEPFLLSPTLVSHLHLMLVLQVVKA